MWRRSNLCPGWCVCCPRAGGGSCCGASQSDGHSWVLHSPDGYETKIHMDWWWIIILFYIIARKGQVHIYSGINVFETLRENQQTHLGLGSEDEKH